MAVPLLDASKFTQGTPAQRATYAQELLGSLSKHGFARISNHGISPELVEECFERSRDFVNLPAEKKRKIINPPGPSPQRGWSTVGAEKTSTLYGKMMGHNVSEDLKDAREHFDVGPKNDDMYPNRWPSQEDLPGFQSFVERFFVLCENVSLDLLEALEEGLQIPASTFRDRCIPSAGEFRMNHYPAISLEELRRDDTNRIWPHFDLGVITLLFSDTTGGLEFQDREKPGTFKPVEPESKMEMIVNISETLQRWTADVLPAGLHQVMVPQDLKDKEEGTIPERYSIAYFCKAARNASVGPLPPFRGIREGDRYEDITALEYQQKRLLTAY